MNKLILSLLLALAALPAEATTKATHRMISGAPANVLDFGADPSGAASSSGAFNAALATGRDVYVPCGTWKLGSTVAIPSGGTLRGAGRCAVLVVPDAGFVGVRVITNSDIVGGNTDISVSDFALQVTTGLPFPVTGQPGIMRFERVNRLSVERIYTTTFVSDYSPIDLAGGNRNFVVRGCILKNTGSGSGGALWVRGGDALAAAHDSYDGVVTGNVLESANDEAFGLYAWFNTISRIQITANVFRSTAASTLAASIVGSNLSQGGIVRDSAMTGNTIYGKVNIITGAHDVSLSDNTIVGPTVGTWDAVFVGQDGFGGAFPYNVRISNNTIRGATRYGIFGGGGANVSVAGNRVSGTAQNGIYLGTYITDNVVDQTAAPAYAGVYSDDASTKLVARNKVYGGSFSGVRLLGTAASGHTLTDSNTWVDSATGYPRQNAGMLAAYKTATAQSFSNGVQARVNFDTLVADDRALVTPGAGWVFTAKVAGQYRVNAQVQFAVAGAASGQEMSIQIFKGPSAVLTGTDRNAIGTSMVTLQATGIVDLAAGDTLDARVYNDTGAAQTLNPDASRNFIDVSLVR